MNNDNMVVVRHLNKTYGKKKVLQDISFEIGHKEIVGFIGPNGAGKSTTMKCLCNLIFPDSGEIIINGYDISTQREKALESQAALIENPGLYLDMTGYENMNLIAKIRNVSNVRLQEMIDFSRLNKSLYMKVRKYSLGMKQRLGLAIALLSKPKFLILDEPTNGLDPTGVIELRSTLLELVKTEDISILFSSHQLGEIEKLANRFICINNGKLIHLPDKSKEKSGYIFRLSDTEYALKLLQVEQNISIQIMTKDTLMLKVDTEQNFHNILNRLILNDIHIQDINKVAIDIEDIYKQVYNKDVD